MGASELESVVPPSGVRLYDYAVHLVSSRPVDDVVDPGDALPDEEPARLGGLEWRASFDALAIAGRIEPTRNSSAINAAAAVMSALTTRTQANVDHFVECMTALDDPAHIDDFVTSVLTGNCQGG